MQTCQGSGVILYIGRYGGRLIDGHSESPGNREGGLGCLNKMKKRSLNL